MSKAEPRVLWEYTWTEDYGEGYGNVPNACTIVFRVVGHFEDDTLAWVTQERLGEDAMGQPAWERLDENPMPERACAELLRLAGLLSSDVDLSQVTG